MKLYCILLTTLLVHGILTQQQQQQRQQFTQYHPQHTQYQQQRQQTQYTVQQNYENERRAVEDELFHRSRKQCHHLSWVESSGGFLFNIIGFVPVMNEYPSELIADGVMRSEVIRFTVQKFNQLHGRNVIG